MRTVSKRPSNRDSRRIRGLSVLPVFFHWKVRRPRLWRNSRVKSPRLSNA
jgi:hypothetical protein